MSLSLGCGPSPTPMRAATVCLSVYQPSPEYLCTADVHYIVIEPSEWAVGSAIGSSPPETQNIHSERAELQSLRGEAELAIRVQLI